MKIPGVIARPFPLLGGRRGLAVAVGAVSVVLGLALLGLGLYRYQVPETPAAPGHASELAFSQRDPGGIYDRPLVPAQIPPAPVPEPAADQAREPPLRDSPYRMVIDSIGVGAPVFPYGLDPNRIPEIPLNPWDVAWYNFTAQPGTGGNAVFAGHVTWNGRAVFYSLDRLVPGDLIALRAENGNELTYTVSEKFLVDADDPNSVSVMAPTTTDVITIITCGGSFYATGDPVFGGDYTHRLVVRAGLTSVIGDRP